MKSNKIFLVSIIAIVLSILYTVIINGFTGGAVSDPNTITVESASCNWRENHFEICEYMNWAQANGYYARGYIAGGESLDKAPIIYSSPATYCQDVGDIEGKRAVHTYLYNSRGELKALDTNNVVNCEMQKVNEENVKQKLQFRAQGEFTLRPKGEGQIKLEGFGGKPVSCTIKGAWKTDNDIIHRTRGYCSGATGNFVGYADQGRQYVLNDPHPFAWQGINGLLTDPEEQLYQGYFIYMNTCDSISYNKQRYYTRARVVDFTDDGIVFDWEYFDDDTSSAIEFDAIVECKIVTNQEPVTVYVEQEPVLEAVKPTQEEVKIPEIKKEAPKEKPKGLFYSLASWFKSLFR
ncbi:MAG TPA: hypothetical protein VJB94_03895 [Candidatus Nanoarchaeia archaeon]|nr:hypothetical protein [Candidatus Nanoarchaeia archaeon]